MIAGDCRGRGVASAVMDAVYMWGREIGGVVCACTAIGGSNNEVEAASR